MDSSIVLFAKIYSKLEYKKKHNLFFTEQEYI